MPINMIGMPMLIGDSSHHPRKPKHLLFITKQTRKNRLALPVPKVVPIELTKLLVERFDLLITCHHSFTV